jgi:hypothetical protein
MRDRSGHVGSYAHNGDYPPSSHRFFTDLSHYPAEDEGRTVTNMKTHVLVASGFAVLLLSACTASVSVGTPTVPAAEVERQATEALAEGQGAPLAEMPPIECPSDLPGEIGASIVCILGDPAAGNTYDVTITVDSVDGDDIGFDVQVAEQPRE